MLVLGRAHRRADRGLLRAERLRLVRVCDLEGVCNQQAQLGRHVAHVDELLYLVSHVLLYGLGAVARLPEDIERLEEVLNLASALDAPVVHDRLALFLSAEQFLQRYVGVRPSAKQGV